MTEEHKKIIRELRRELVPYSVIAKQLGLNVNSVKMFSYRNGLHTSAIKGTAHLCLNCGKVLKASRTHPRKYCSNKCKLEYWRGHRIKPSDKLVETRCTMCGRTIKDYASAKRKYCSLECYYNR